jgi:hypothetical protein
MRRCSWPCRRKSARLPITFRVSLAISRSKTWLPRDSRHPPRWTAHRSVLPRHGQPQRLPEAQSGSCGSPVGRPRRHVSLPTSARASSIKTLESGAARCGRCRAAPRSGSASCRGLVRASFFSAIRPSKSGFCQPRRKREKFVEIRAGSWYSAWHSWDDTLVSESRFFDDLIVSRNRLRPLFRTMKTN